MQLLAVLDASGVRVEAVVFRHPLAPQDLLTEPLPLALVLYPEEDDFTIPAPERSVGCYRRVCSTAAPWLLTAVPGEVRGKPIHSPNASSIETSSVAPSPVLSRLKSAESTPE